uniref:NR LBD domain-containing protein n=1 Tax=Heterorhabditis bacteriophora TaxID=37862 RepID=A0A1I7XFP5_HETBA
MSVRESPCGSNSVHDDSEILSMKSEHRCNPYITDSNSPVSPSSLVNTVFERLNALLPEEQINQQLDGCYENLFVDNLPPLPKVVSYEPYWRSIEENLKTLRQQDAEISKDLEQTNLSIYSTYITLCALEEARWLNDVSKDPELSRLVHEIDPQFPLAVNSTTHLFEQQEAVSSSTSAHESNIFPENSDNKFITDFRLDRNNTTSNFNCINRKRFLKQETVRDHRISTWMSDLIDHIDKLISIPCNFSTSEEMVCDGQVVKLRGSTEWAPPRDAWIFTLRKNDSEFPVCDRALRFLSDAFDQPAIHVSTVAPSLVEKIRILKHVIIMRKKLSCMWEFIKICSLAEDTITKNGNFVCRTHIFAIYVVTTNSSCSHTSRRRCFDATNVDHWHILSVMQNTVEKPVIPVTVQSVRGSKKLGNVSVSSASRTHNKTVRVLEARISRYSMRIRACRLAKCIAVGMDKKAVQPKREGQAIVSSAGKLASDRNLVAHGSDLEYDRPGHMVSPKLETDNLMSPSSAFTHVSGTPVSSLGDMFMPALPPSPPPNCGLITRQCYDYSDQKRRRRAMLCRSLEEILANDCVRFLHYDFLKSEDTAVRSIATAEDYTNLFQVQMVLMFEWAEKLPEFSLLSDPMDKTKLLRSFALRYILLDNVFHTMEMGYTDRVVLVNNNYMKPYELPECHVNELADETMVKMFMFGHETKAMLDDLIIPMMHMRLTVGEMMTLRMIMFWNPGNVGLTPQGVEVARGASNNAVRELHVYFEGEGITDVEHRIGNLLLLLPSFTKHVQFLYETVKLIPNFGKMNEWDSFMDDLLNGF